MSKLEELIEQYCPDGVEYVPLSSIGTIKRGNGLQKKDFVKAGIGCIHYGQIYTKFGLFTNKTLTYVDKELADHLLHIEKGDLVIACTSENVEDVCKAVAWLGDDSIVTGGHSCVLHHNQNPKYIAYFFQTESFQRQKRKYAYGTKVIDIKPDSIGKIEIPLPPLPVQEEIVRILDAFTELQAELQAELQKRKQQYNYYRDNLLAFEDKKDIQWKHLGDICDIKGRIGFRGYTREDQVKEGEGALSLSPSNIQDGQMDYSKGTYITWSKYDESPEIKTYNGDIIFCKTASVGKVAVVKNLPYKATINPQLVVLKNIQCSASFLAYVLETNSIQSKVISMAGVGSVPNISQKALSDIYIPIPSLYEQQRLVDILDMFNALANDLAAGLPAEIEKRRLQYEYYRDKLLTFKRKGA